MSLKRPLVIFITGVSGVGKSIIGKLLAQELSIPFFDGDDYHSEENILKMKKALPLTDTDRYPWLKTLNTLAKKQLAQQSCIIACSALKDSYRKILQEAIESQVKWVFLDGKFDLIHSRLQQRNTHFMPASLLQSQFDALEFPAEALTVPITLPPEDIVQRLKTELVEKAAFGIIGLGVMGTSIARNMASKGYALALFNRYIKNTEEKIAEKTVQQYPELKDALPFDDLEAFVHSLQQPRKLLLMINAGKPVDMVLENLMPLLSDHDVVIDGGNSHYKDTQRREKYAKKYGVFYIGTGISGGEEGALYGPSLMPSGNSKGYDLVKSFLRDMAAKDKDGQPCCTYMGPEGSGHFVKMVHNGIEYAEMQLLAEIYTILKHSGKNPDEIALILESWKPTAGSYLLEITIEILRTKERGDWLLNKILDKSSHKGTGNWATIAATELGVPVTMMTSALYARYLSAYKPIRTEAASAYKNLDNSTTDLKTEHLLKAYQLARYINHAQAFKLLEEASTTYQWQLNLSDIARIWSNGCIIRSLLIEELKDILKKSTEILLHSSVVSKMNEYIPKAKEIVSLAISNHIPIPCLTEALNFFNGYRTHHSSANLIQAQRDYFGAHTYQRIDDLTGKSYHTDWKKLKDL